jgi:hypothetical protein
MENWKEIHATRGVVDVWDELRAQVDIVAHDQEIGHREDPDALMGIRSMHSAKVTSSGAGWGGGTYAVVGRVLGAVGTEGGTEDAELHPTRVCAQSFERH